MYQDNLDLSPGFVNDQKDDYRLAPGSPCLARGDFLTRAVGAGRGKTIPVEDARWFYDGFAIQSERGDDVFVGPRKQTARVLHTDRTGNTLTLDREVSWQNGDPVSLPYAGKAPDLGAFERGREGRLGSGKLAVPAAYRWHLPSEPDAPLVATDFEDSDVDAWGHLWYWGRFDIPGSAVQARRVTDTAFKGTHSVELKADKDGPALEASISARSGIWTAIRGCGSLTGFPGGCPWAWRWTPSPRRGPPAPVASPWGAAQPVWRRQSPTSNAAV